MPSMRDFQSPERPTWCPGCGDYGILSALKQALVKLELEPHEILLVSGIGCGSKLPHYLRANGFNTIHGRPVPAAQGIKLANHDLKVITTSGDGDSYGIGAGHLVHAMRRNADITQIVENNMVYGLTKGQYSPTSRRGFVTSTSPEGAIEFAFNPIAAALAEGATFIARGFAGDPQHLADLMAQAIEHEGYALLDVFQPCVVFNRINTYDFFNEKIYKLEESGHDVRDYESAVKKANQWEEGIPIGVFYKEERPTYGEQVSALEHGPLVKQEWGKPSDYEEIKELYV